MGAIFASTVTRFAPKRSAVNHIGGWTALFNYAYAKKKNGKFLIRIEDTEYIFKKQPCCCKKTL